MDRAKAIFLACAALAAASRGAEGDWLTWGGVLAGSGMTGARTTMLGGAAGGGAQGADRCVFIGTGAGAYSTNLTRCVAIGHGAMSRAAALNGATWINGQLFASSTGNEFWIKPSPDAPATNAPIRYADGVLDINATVRINGGEISGGGPSVPSLAGYDLYVDPVNGDDAFSGLSAASAKRTIDAALLLPGTNVCLLAGDHSAPTNVEESAARRYFAPSGKGVTRVDGSSGSEGFAAAYVEGCTLTGLRAAKNGAAAFGGAASNCVISLSVHRQTAVGVAGSLTGCDVTCTLMYPGDQTMRGMLYGVQASGSVFRIGTTNDSAVVVQAGGDSTLDNCVIMATNVGAIVYSGKLTLRDSTVICPSASLGWVNADNPSAAVVASGSLFGCGAAADFWDVGGTGNVCTNAAAVAAAIGADFRPAATNWLYRFTGYGSAPDRALRDSVLASVRAALAAEGN